MDDFSGQLVMCNGSVHMWLSSTCKSEKVKEDPYPDLSLILVWS